MDRFEKANLDKSDSRPSLRDLALDRQVLTQPLKKPELGDTTGEELSRSFSAVAGKSAMAGAPAFMRGSSAFKPSGLSKD